LPLARSLIHLFSSGHKDS